MPDSPREKYIRIKTDLTDFDIATDFEAIADKIDSIVADKIEEVMGQLTDSEIREWFKKYLLMTCRTQILGDVAGEILEHSRIKRITPETKALAKEVRAELKAYEEFGNEFYALQKDMPCGFMYETGWISLGKTPLK